MHVLNHFSVGLSGSLLSATVIERAETMYSMVEHCSRTIQSPQLHQVVMSIREAWEMWDVLFPGLVESGDAYFCNLPSTHTSNM